MTFSRLFLSLVLFSSFSCMITPKTVVEYQPDNSVIKHLSSENNTPIDDKPPRIEVLSPLPNSNRSIVAVPHTTRFEIRGYVIDESPIAHFSIDDHEIALSDDGSFSYSAMVKEGKNIFTLLAIDKNNNQTNKPIIMEGTNKQPTPIKALEGIYAGPKPNLWALTIGVSEYLNPSLNLRYADNDALAFANTLRKTSKGLFGDVRVKTLVNEQATRKNIIKAISTHLTKAGPNDIVLIFAAGHGAINPQTGSYYFLTHNTDAQNLLFEGLKWSDFDEAVKIISTNVNKVVLLIDTCHSGALNASMRDVKSGVDLVDTMKVASGLYILSASKSGEVSIEDSNFRLSGETRGHGAFTYALLKGFREANFDGNSYLTVSELFSYVANMVPRITKGQQHPYSKINGTDLPIVIGR